MLKSWGIYKVREMDRLSVLYFTIIVTDGILLL